MRAALAVARKDLLTEWRSRELVSHGLIEEETSEELMREARQEVQATVRKFQGSRPDTDILRDAVREAATRLQHRRTRRRPMVIPVVTEI